MGVGSVARSHLLARRANIETVALLRFGFSANRGETTDTLAMLNVNEAPRNKSFGAFIAKEVILVVKEAVWRRANEGLG